MSIHMGKKVTDRITGFTGIVTGMVAYISGNDQAMVTPPVDKDGKLVDAQWFDLERLTVDEAAGQILIGAEVDPD